MYASTKKILFSAILVFALLSLTVNTVYASTFFKVHSGVKLHTVKSVTTVGSTLTLSGLRVNTGSLVLSGVTWTITPTGFTKITLNSFNPTSLTTAFTANGTDTTYQWSWSRSNPYVSEVKGEVTALTIYDWVDAISVKKLVIDITATGT